MTSAREALAVASVSRLITEVAENDQQLHRDIEEKDHKAPQYNTHSDQQYTETQMLDILAAAEQIGAIRKRDPAEKYSNILKSIRDGTTLSSQAVLEKTADALGLPLQDIEIARMRLYPSAIEQQHTLQALNAEPTPAAMIQGALNAYVNQFRKDALDIAIRRYDVDVTMREQVPEGIIQVFCEKRKHTRSFWHGFSCQGPIAKMRFGVSENNVDLIGDIYDPSFVASFGDSMILLRSRFNGSHKITYHYAIQEE
jgi:hypothetical protein